MRGGLVDADDVPSWWIFAGILLGISGVLNVIWGIAAISESHFFVLNTHYILSELKTWGWITLILGVAQLIAAVSLFAGGTYGRWFGVATARWWRSPRCSTSLLIRSGHCACSRSR